MVVTVLVDAVCNVVSISVVVCPGAELITTIVDAGNVVSYVVVIVDAGMTMVSVWNTVVD